MSKQLLVPYDDSIRLGERYNSFLQTPCLEQAISLQPQVDIVTRHPGNSDNTASQTIEYSARLVGNISEVAEILRLSAASCIKQDGTIAAYGSLAVDDVKFTNCDFKAVVSVNVINETREMLIERAKFNPVKGVEADNERFMEVYGDSFVSGRNLVKH